MGHEKVDVILFAVEFLELCAEIAADFAGNDLESFYVLFLEDLSAIFCDKDQVYI